MPKHAHSVLLTGFEPFGGLTYNPSHDLVETMAQLSEATQLLAQREHGTITIHTEVLSVEFGRAGRQLIQAVEKHQPDVVIAVGLASGTPHLRLERVGLNLRDAQIPDNAGAQPLGEPIDPAGQNAYFSTLRLKAAEQRMAAAGLPVALSLSAGTYLCNEVLYSLLQHIDHSRLPARAGFVHIPDLRSRDSPLTGQQAAHGLDLTIAEALRSEPDAASATGALH